MSTPRSAGATAPAGGELSYVSARCGSGVFQTHGSFTFAGGTTISGSVFERLSAPGSDGADSYTCRPGPLAQLVEQETLNLKVVGSSPTRPIPALRGRLDCVIGGLVCRAHGARRFIASHPLNAGRSSPDDRPPPRPPSGFLSVSLPLPFDSFASALTCFWKAFARLRTSASWVSSCFFCALEVARDCACLAVLSAPAKSKAKYWNSASVLTEPRVGWASATICWAWAAAFRFASASAPDVEVSASLKRAPATSWAVDALGSCRPASGSGSRLRWLFRARTRAAGVTVGCPVVALTSDSALPALIRVRVRESSRLASSGLFLSFLSMLVACSSYRLGGAAGRAVGAEQAADVDRADDEEEAGAHQQGEDRVDDADDVLAPPSDVEDHPPLTARCHRPDYRS